MRNFTAHDWIQEATGIDVADRRKAMEIVSIFCHGCKHFKAHEGMYGSFLYATCEKEGECEHR